MRTPLSLIIGAELDQSLDHVRPVAEPASLTTLTAQFPPG